MSFSVFRLLKKYTFFTLYTIAIYISIFLLSSCDEPSKSRKLTMKDGNTIYIHNDTIAYYDNESDFVHSVAFLYNSPYSFSSQNTGPYLVGDKYSINGYDDRFFGIWERVKFGDWIENYGLNSDTIYYCTTIKYVIYLPLLPEAQNYVPVFPMNEMGFSPWSKRRTFEVDTQINYPKCVLYTGIRFIGYDEDRNGIYQEIPKINLIWKFTVI